MLSQARPVHFFSVIAMKVWVFLDGRQQGPFEKESLTALPGFNENTKVWFDGLPKWYPAGSLDELHDLFERQQNDASANVEADTAAEAGGEDAEVVMTEENTQQGTEEETIVIEEAEETPVSRFAPGQSYKAYRVNDVKLDEPCPPTYLAWSIFLLLCCTSPVSIAAVVASALVSTYYSRGNMEKAKKTSEVAAWLIMISIALGSLPWMVFSAMFS